MSLHHGKSNPQFLTVNLGIEVEDLAKGSARMPDATTTEAAASRLEKEVGYMSETNATPQSQDDTMRLRYGFWIVLAGIGTVVVLFLALIIDIAVMNYEGETSDMAAMLSSAIGVIGTLVGTFFGHQLGSAGKERAEASRHEAQKSTMVALTMLPPDAQEEMRQRLER